MKSKVKCMDIAVRNVTLPHLYGNSHVIWEITQCYLPPDRGDILAFTPAETGTLATPEGCNAELTKHYSKGAQPVPKTAHHNGIRDKHSRPRWDSNLGSSHAADRCANHEATATLQSQCFGIVL